MDNLNKYLQQFIEQKLTKTNLKFSQNKSGREGVDFILKTNAGNLHEVYL